MPSPRSPEPAEPPDGTDAPGRPVLEPSPPTRRGLRRFVPGPVLQIGRLLVLALIIEYLVVPQIAGTRKAIHTLGQVDPLLLLLGVGLEAASIVAYAQLTRAVLPAGSQPSLFKLFRIHLTTMSVSHVVPGGSAAGSSLGYRLLTQAGITGSDAGFALATEALGSAVVLNVIFWLALVISIPVWGISALYITAAGVGAVFIGAFVALVALFSRGDAIARGVLRRIAARLPLVEEDAVVQLFVRLSVRVRSLASQRSVLAWAVVWAAVNWLLDAASLFVFVGAFGHWVNPDGLLVAYGLANVLAALPLTPGGLGVVEVTLTSALVGFDTTRAVAILGVVAYRLVNFWLPIPLGGVAYLSLQVDPTQKGGRTRVEGMTRLAGHAFGSESRWRHAQRERNSRRAAGREPVDV